MPESVLIYSETRVPLLVAPGVIQEMIALTYGTAAIPPRTVYIDPDHDSEAERKAKIQADLKAYREAKPNTLNIG